MEIGYGVIREFPYSIWEQSGGYLCGYIGVPKGHLWYGSHYSDRVLENVVVHGGITFSRHEANGKAYPHDTGLDIWWIGFDCAHLGDGTNFCSGIRRDLDSVFGELERLAQQAAEAVGSA